MAGSHAHARSRCSRVLTAAGLGSLGLREALHKELFSPRILPGDPGGELCPLLYQPQGRGSGLLVVLTREREAGSPLVPRRPEGGLRLASRGRGGRGGQREPAGSGAAGGAPRCVAPQTPRPPDTWCPEHASDSR